MTAITFDTLKIVQTLREAGFDQQQAEAMTKALRSAIEDSELVTRKDLQLELAPVKADLTLLKWMMGATFGAVLFVLLRLVLPGVH